MILRGGHIPRGEILGIRLILAGREGNHVVECTHFHTHMHLAGILHVCSHDITQWARRGAFTGVYCRSAMVR